MSWMAVFCLLEEDQGQDWPPDEATRGWSRVTAECLATMTPAMSAPCEGRARFRLYLFPADGPRDEP